MSSRTTPPNSLDSDLLCPTDAICPQRSRTSANSPSASGAHQSRCDPTCQRDSSASPSCLVCACPLCPCSFAFPTPAPRSVLDCVSLLARAHPEAMRLSRGFPPLWYHSPSPIGSMSLLWRIAGRAVLQVTMFWYMLIFRCWPGGRCASHVSASLLPFPCG
ncbi:hypothetical protein BC628DRAFT_966553 [Trametes gibbosa]|nr:hypothetical protein BC628DRAFT_966553 [Trametes gibbosa]